MRIPNFLRPWVGLAVNTVIVGGLAAVLILANPSVAAGGIPDSMRPADRIPVILVHGALNTPDGAWGGTSDPAGFYQFLVGRGYEPGITLFCVDYGDSPDGDYAALYPRLHRAVELARARSGHRKVDVVTHSMGALLARYYVAGPLYDGGVRNLVMLAPPSNGSFAVTSLRAALITVAQEERRMRAGPLAGPGAGGSTDSFPEFRGEHEYVARRASEFYEPLYGEFVLDTRIRGAPKASTESFEEWLARSKPEVYRACFLEALEPPLRPDWDMGDAPGPGRDLTRAYYERLGLEVGRNNYLKYGRARPTLAETLAKSPPPLSGDPVEILKEYSKRVLFYFAGRLLDIGATKGKVALAGILESRFKVNADSPALRRMVCTEIRGVPSSEPVLANHFLSRWTGLEQANRASVESSSTMGYWPENPRYVVIAGGAVAANIPWMGGVGENDGAVEIRSALVTPGSDDVFTVFRGLVWPNHLGLLKNSAVRRYVASQLETYFPVRTTHYPSFREKALKWFRWSESGEMAVTPWAPTYIAVDSSKLRGEAGSLKIHLDSDNLPGQMGLRAWVYVVSRDGMLGRREVALSAPSRTGVTVGTISVDGFGSPYGRVLLGLRLTGSFASDAEMRRMEGIASPVKYTLSFEPSAYEPSGQEPSGHEPSGLPGTPGGSLETPGDDGGEAETPEAGGHGAAGAAGRADPATNEEIPTIRVIRTTKKTVPGDFLLGECSVWVWDFGDGTGHRDEGAGDRSTVSHAFSPGEYTVRAKALDSRDRVIREESWSVTAPQLAEDTASPPTEIEFVAGGDGNDDPDIRVEVIGPSMWVTGRPARFEVKVDASGARLSGKEVITVEPGREFQVIWEKPGTFQVAAAAKVRLTYERPGGRVSITRTCTGATTVKVAATGVTD